jgi:hypothetical protein
MYPHKWDICFLLLGVVVERSVGDTTGAEETPPEPLPDDWGGSAAVSGSSRLYDDTVLSRLYDVLFVPVVSRFIKP